MQCYNSMDNYVFVKHSIANNQLETLYVVHELTRNVFSIVVFVDYCKLLCLSH
jgi:hypothetical protein